MNIIKSPQKEQNSLSENIIGNPNLARPFMNSKKKKNNNASHENLHGNHKHIWHPYLEFKNENN